ncbi:host cell RNA polymerase inhibitor [Pseudomonas chlororaphis]|uniref:host cell RNA polymerase inhibitor n=1 Tax=Pseudomonas chlororaphis TaxID=587753 RepID=UPI0006A5E8E0|nr:host cell RNA polymerase inhibitor [Pseudomonas chlororaphis]
MEQAVKTFKATVAMGKHTDEVTIYAVSLEDATEKAEERFSDVVRVRPAVAPNIQRFGVTQ